MGTDSALVLFSKRGLCEVIDISHGWHRFQLRAPGVSALSLPAVVRNAAGVDPARLEAVILGLRDEVQLANGLNALAALRLAEK